MNEPTLDEIIAARDRCAQIIAQYGSSYLPIFERLENEISIREKRQKLLEKAMRLSSENGTHNGTHSGTHLILHFSRHSK